jgi:hypothetical protein
LSETKPGKPKKQRPTKPDQTDEKLQVGFDGVLRRMLATPAQKTSKVGGADNPKKVR